MATKRTTPATPKKRKRPKWCDVFLDALARSGNALLSANAAKVARHRAYDRRRSDPSFAAEWEAAIDSAADILEAEAQRRAVKGVDKHIFHNGKLIHVEKQYSDTLLIFLMKGARPRKYRDSAPLPDQPTATLPPRIMIPAPEVDPPSDAD